MEIINGVKVYDKADIDKVTDDLESRGAKCIVNVTSTRKFDDDIGFILRSINVRFPSGNKWNIVDIDMCEASHE